MCLGLVLIQTLQFYLLGPTLSATNINGNTFGTFFLHKFTTSVWDLDHVFLGGHTQILETRILTRATLY